MFLSGKQIFISQELFKKSVRFLRGKIHFEKIEKKEVENVNTPTKLLKVAIIGMPNAGKSTLINNLMDRKVCPTSKKVHTTRNKSMAVFTEDDKQIVFLDTPGLVNDKEMKKFNLEKNFMRDCKKSLKEADLIGVIQDCSNIYTRERLDIKVLKLLEYFKEKGSFLVLNKVDLVTTKRKLLDLTRILTDNCIKGQPIASGKRLVKDDDDTRGWPYFEEVFMVSALIGDGIEQLRNYLLKSAKPNEWMFPDNVWSDQTPEKIIVDSVKAKLMDFLPQEIPYEIKPILEFFERNEEGTIQTIVNLNCPNERIKNLVAGSGDGKLRQITESLQHDLQCTFHNYVRIKLILVNKNTRK